MSKIEDFMAFIAKHEENEDLTADMAKKAEESESTKDYITADGIHVSKACFDSVKIIFCDMPPYMLKDPEMNSLFDRLAENFIKSNTEKDIKKFVTHQAIVKMMSLFT